MGKEVTIKDIAKKLGIHHTTCREHCMVINSLKKKPETAYYKKHLRWDISRIYWLKASEVGEPT